MDGTKVRTITKADLVSICDVLGVDARQVEQIQVAPRNVYVTMQAEVVDGERITRTLHLAVSG